MVIAIDGPAGSGKSTVAKELARRLEFIYIDTGAMYRAVGLLALRRGIALDDAAALEQLAAEAGIHFVLAPGGNRLMAGDEDITDLIRTPEVTRASSIISTVPGVRREMVALQQRMGSQGDIVMEGRDIGSVVFPGAEVKIFLEASEEERAQRRAAEMDDPPALPALIEQIRERDARDSEREHSPLLRAPGAEVLDSTRLSIEEVIARIEALALTALGRSR